MDFYSDKSVLVRLIKTTFFSGVMILFNSAAMAEQLENVGTVYQIKEKDAVEAIMQKLNSMNESGELKKLEQQAIERSVNSIKNPKPVVGIRTTKVASSKLFDPSVTYEEAIVTDDNTIIAPAGTRVNPLDHISLSKSMIFFSGDDPDQVKAVKALVDKHKTAVRPILVSGSWLNISRQWQMQVYFDQGGYLSNRFGIETVPTVVRQVGNMLEIAAIPAGELK